MKRMLESRLERFVESCINRRAWVAGIFFLVTAAMLAIATKVEVRTVFEDLLPRSHPYIQVHEQYKHAFGGSNVVSIVLEAERGDIFSTPFLNKVKQVTTALQQVDGANQFQIVSLASRKLKEIRGSTDAIDSNPLMWPDVPQDQAGIDKLKQAVLNNPLVYGAYVSRDLKSALVTVDFYENAADYNKIFPQVMSIADSVRGDGVRVRVTGEPILYGWVKHFLPETLQIFLFTIGCLVLLLFLIARTWRGTLLPLLAGVSSAAWALGTARLLGFNLDPLVIVIAFLITARAISHAVQLVSRFDEELATGVPTTRAAAKASMLQLFKPGMLGVVADAGCMIVVVLTPIPLMHKVSIIGTVWVMTIAISACVMTPVLLSWVRYPRGYAHGLDLGRYLDRVLDICVRTATTRWRYAVLTATVAVFGVSAWYAARIQVGDAQPGSPILWQDSSYNRDAAAINRQFQGADRLYAVFSGRKPNAVKEPHVLESMTGLQRYMAAQPEIGGSMSIADVIPMVRRVLNENNPRYLEPGRTAEENGELMYMFVSGSDPGDMARFTDTQSKDASVTFFFRDHRGDSIRTAMARLKAYVDAHPLAEGTYRLAGGLVGVLAAVNEVILAGQIESIALALLVLVVCCAVAYRSMTAGIFFMVPVILSNTITFSYMAWKGIGMNLSTLPVAALGIGLGVDYAFYIVDGIKEKLAEGKDLTAATIASLHGAGRGVMVTALTLTTSVVLWCASSLRFQADMGVLMAIWLFVSAVSALFIMPAMVLVFRPAFIVRTAEKREADGVGDAPIRAIPEV
ncbi:efflux RND transporter permease subunit [Cupriavidus pinatubonensis]|uniref:efflux RND transporter permease subunit n=1 Tax=Cupriavidus pinatubonensis TaxID=248026 RepID=UPI00112C3653|nr:MMPL family transporter [Cupriavidus pinatubonensis]TPQ32889.1 RND transporter [Cupriavidus pinatubonensis]